nr:hypothetical protein [Paraburkholderia sp. BL6669N2]
MRSIETRAPQLDLTGNMKRLNSLLSWSAYPVLGATGALHQARLRKRSLNSLHVGECGQASP